MAIVVAPHRSGADDLWPCIWFLASVLERQFTGRVIVSGLKHQLSAPLRLGPRCELVETIPTDCELTIYVGQQQSHCCNTSIFGDARGSRVSYGAILSGTEPATPISCCALAGYLGFSALAHAVGLPPFREGLRESTLQLPFSAGPTSLPPFSVLGVGQVGQAFLALGYFLSGKQSMSVHIVDKDYLEDYNQRTQVLLPEPVSEWCGKLKVEYLAQLCRGWGWDVVQEHEEIKWGWKRKDLGQAFAFLGFDNMDARRIAVEGGFPWLFECGVGTDFCRPRVSWHSLPPDRELAKRVFRTPPERIQHPSAFAQSLAASPGDCGRVVFENIDASAPSLGLVAVAFTWADLVRHLSGDHAPYSGTALLWSPLLPPLREELNVKSSTGI